MPDDFKFDVFLSHSSKDKPVVRDLAERLKKDGLKVWFDEWVLKPGDDVSAKIEEGLEQSQVLILCVSIHAFGSEWAQLESQTSRFRDPLNKDRRFIPLQFDEAPVNESLAQFLYLNWQPAKREQTYPRMLAACQTKRTEPLTASNEATQEFLKKIQSLGHTAVVLSVAWSADGTRLLSGGADQTVRVWDAADGHCLRVLEGHTDWVRSVAWSADGTRLLSGGEDQTVRMWDAADGRCLRVLKGHTARVWSVAWSADGTRLLSGGEDQTVRVWDAADGRCLRVLKGHTDRVRSVAWSADGTRLLSGGEDQTVRVWDAADGRCLRVLKGHTDRVRSVAWSADGTRLLSGGADKTVRVWDAADGRCLRVLKGHTAIVLSVAWSADSTRLLSGGEDQTVRMWDAADGRCLRVLAGHTAIVLSVAWSADSTRLLSGGEDQTVRMWDAADGRCLRVLEGHTDRVRSVAWRADGTRLLSGGEDQTVRVWDAADGRCLRVLEGHTDSVWSVAWSADGTRLLSGGADQTVRVWDVADGRCLRVLEGHTDSVWSVAWSADGTRLLSGGADQTVRMWDAADGRCLRVLEGHTAMVLSVAWRADGTRLLSGGTDQTVRMWDAADGRCLRVLEGHTASVLSVAWSADGTRLLSGGADQTVRMWDAADGRCLRVLEGHTASVLSVAWSADGTRLLSGGADQTVRMWDAADGRCLRVLAGHTATIWSVAWSQNGQRAFSAADNGVWREWDVSEPMIGIKTAERPAQVQYMNAKVLLVGDTGVGKSGLAERLVCKHFIATKSSHARKAYVLESNSVPNARGVALHRETVLWDLAGQPAYRLVHQLSMEGAAVACVLFDNRSETNPFEGAAYWSQVLDQARTSAKIKKILVASRIDVGGLPASRERIEAFAAEHGFAQFIPTSANTGEGCETLLDAIRKGIAWIDLPKVTTEGPLAPLRAYVARLKGEKDGKTPVATKLFTIAQLHEGFSADYGTKIPLEEFISHLERLEATDAVDLLVFRTTGASPRSETLVLLDPTRVDAYASALLVAAKDESDGPGHLLQSRVREAAFKLDPAERLADAEAEKHVLWFVMESLLARDLALSEKIKGEDYFVFPSQCTAELRFPGVAAFGMAFGFAGAVRSIYATLIAQLAHFESFKKREFYQDAATYRPDSGGRCIVRLHDHGRGQGELELSFETETPPPVRQGFIEFVGKHLESKCTLGSITKRHAYHCANQDCRKPFDDALVKARLETHKKQLLCPYCEEQTPLFDLLAAPTAAAESVAAQIVSDAKTGRQRMTAAFVIKAKEAENKFDVFLSHNSKDKAAVEKIAKRLLTVGIRPWLDKWQLSPGDAISKALEKAIKTIPCAVLCFGPADVGNWHIMEITAYLERWAGGNARIIPVILPEVKETPELPMFVRQTLWVDMRDWEKAEHDGFYRLVCGILGRAPGDSPMKKFGVRHVAEWQGGKK